MLIRDGTTIPIRAARPEEAERLTALAIASKAIWRYDNDFMMACRDELTVAPDDLGLAAFVAEAGGHIAGFYALDHLNDGEVELGYLFVDPCQLRRGIGRSLMRHACITATELGYSRLVIVGDPHAEDFYLAMGAIRVGDFPSASIPGRNLPLFHVPLPVHGWLDREHPYESEPCSKSAGRPLMTQMGSVSYVRT